jgi:nucleotide-binding universal stress UspA family protein
MSASVPQPQRQRIVVGVDGSSASTGALHWAAGEARRHGARLEVVIAWRPSAAVAAPPGGHPPASSRTLQEHRADAEAVLDIALGEISTSGIEIDRRAMRGSPHRVLLEASDGADMLVIGGRSGKLAGKLPWSTGQQVLSDASCPVVVVPAAAARLAEQHDTEPAGESRSAHASAGVVGGGVLPG